MLRVGGLVGVRACACVWWVAVGCQGRVEKATVKGATGNGRNRGRVDEPGYKSSRVGEGGWKGWEDFDQDV